MSNKRDLKKVINGICSELFAECISSSLYSSKIDKENLDAMLKSIIMMNSNYIRRISHPEPGMKSKTYYKNLIEDFNKEISELIDQISAQ